MLEVHQCLQDLIVTSLDGIHHVVGREVVVIATGGSVREIERARGGVSEVDLLYEDHHLRDVACQEEVLLLEVTDMRDAPLLEAGCETAITIEIESGTGRWIEEYEIEKEIAISSAEMRGQLKNIILFLFLHLI